MLAHLEFPSRDERLTGDELRHAADRLAGALRESGVQPGDIVGVLAPSGAVVPIALFAIWRTGAAATVLPVRPVIAADKAAALLARIVTAAGMTHVVVAPEHTHIALELLKHAPELTIVDSAAQGRIAAPITGELAFVQFTSGSTSAPKGVMLSHDAIQAGIQAVIDRSGLTARDRLVQWIPFFHDMGLFTFLAALQAGAPVHVFSPLEFMARPAKVMRHFADVGGTVMYAPNFGYDRLLEGIPADVDLSSWRAAFNGGELVQPSTVERFGQRVGPEVMVPCYGMAEATLVLTCHHPGTRPRIVHIDRDNHEAITPGSKAVVSVGPPAPGIELRLVNHAGVCGNAQPGEVQARGAAVMSGYLRNPEATDAAFDGDWLRTGDLGFQLDGDLFLTGRSKEMIVAYGQNHYPEDVELIVRELPGVYRRRCVAFAHEERIFVAVEAEKGAEATLAAAAGRQVTAELGLAAIDVHVVPRSTLPQTSSGKWQRGLARDQLLKSSPPSGPGEVRGGTHAHA